MASKFSYTPNEKAKQHSVNYDKWLFSRGDERSTSTSYAGTDISVYLTYNGVLYNLPGAQTVTVSSHTARTPIRPIGMRGPRGFATGSSTYAGTIIIAMDYEEPLIRLIKNGGDEIIKLSPTLLPPFNIMMTYQGEYDKGGYSVARIWNARIVDHGQTLSVNDLMTEVVYQYVAEDYDLVQQGQDGSTPLTNGIEDNISSDSNSSALSSRTLIYSIAEKINALQLFIETTRAALYDDWVANVDGERANYPVFADYMESTMAFPVGIDISYGVINYLNDELNLNIVDSPGTLTGTYPIIKDNISEAMIKLREERYRYLITDGNRFDLSKIKMESPL